MGLEIRELRAEDAEHVAALWVKYAPDRPAESVRQTVLQVRRDFPGLCLVAEVDGRVMGVTLCGRDPRGSYVQRVAIDPEADGSLCRLLVGRAVAKVVGKGIGKCHVLVAGDPQPDAFFETLRLTTTDSSSGHAA